MMVRCDTRENVNFTNTTTLVAEFEAINAATHERLERPDRPVPRMSVDICDSSHASPGSTP